MRFKDLTPEQIEQAKKCETPEERMAFIEENAIELSDEQLDGVAGGGTGAGSCAGSGRNSHDWVYAGETRPNKLWGDELPDRKYRCRKCGETVWKRVNIV